MSVVTRDFVRNCPELGQEALHMQAEYEHLLTLSKDALAVLILRLRGASTNKGTTLEE